MIFDYLEYRKYLVYKLGGTGTRTGKRKRMAEALRLHTTFISQVLNHKADFSIEQAEFANEYLEHSELEGEYFIYLVLKDRAENPKLKKRFLDKIDQIRKSMLNIKDRINTHKEIQREDKVRFYSNPYYAAIHVLCSIITINTPNDVANALKLSLNETQTMLEFLIQIGMVQVVDGKLESGTQFVHIGQDSDLLSLHHRNWRLQSLSKLQNMDKEDFHYSACMSLSVSDAFKIKNILIEQLKKNLKIVGDSKEEAAFVYNIDFYNLLK